MGLSLRIRTDAGEEEMDLQELEARAARGEVAPHCLVYFPVVTGERWVPVGELEIFRGLYSPRRLYFSRAFSLGRFPRITALVVLGNLVVFLFTRASPGPEVDAMVAFGAKAPSLVLDLGELWRLLAANFVHRDGLHIAFNLFVLFNAGGAMESAYRPLDYLLLLLASALGTTCASLVFSPAVSAGASGMVYGALGGAVVFGVKYREILPPRYRRVLGEAIIPTVLVFLYIGWTSSGIDNWGHLGGLATGVVAAAFMRPRLLAERPLGWGGRLARLVPLALVAVGLLFGGRLLKPWLPPMNWQRDETFGMAVPVPAEWQSRGQLAFGNGLPGLGRASFEERARMGEGPFDLEREAAAYIKERLAAEEEAGRLNAVEAAAPVPSFIGGRPGVRLEARYQDESGATRVRAYFIPRGDLLFQLVFEWPEAFPDYQRVIEKMSDGARFVETKGLREARGRAFLLPSAASLAVLGEALRRLGEPAQAEQAFARALEQRPRDGELRARRSLALAVAGELSKACREANQALADAPLSALAREAAARCASGRGDLAEASRQLQKAVELAPDDPRLKRKLSAVAGPPH